MELKRCQYCKKRKALIAFSCDKGRKDGKAIYCKRCRSIQHSAYSQGEITPQEKRALIKLGPKWVEAGEIGEMGKTLGTLTRKGFVERKRRIMSDEPNLYRLKVFS